jgi:hypothetical protein
MDSSREGLDCSVQAETDSRCPKPPFTTSSRYVACRTGRAALATQHGEGVIRFA